MNNYANENDDADFSMICPQSQNINRLDFSIQSLLSHPPTESQKNEPQNSYSQSLKKCAQGSFMKDLQKMEKQISYESEPYNIYDLSENVHQLTHTLEVKQQSTQAKTLNNTKGTSRMFQKQCEIQINHLIVDFKEEKEGSYFKQKVQFDDYFGLNTEKQRNAECCGKQKNISVINLTPMNLKIKNKKRKEKLKTQNSASKTDRSHKSQKSTISVNKTQRKMLKKENNQISDTIKRSTSKSSKQRFMREKKEQKKKTIRQEYYGYKNENTVSRKQKSSTKNSVEKTRKIIISRKNIHTFN